MTPTMTLTTSRRAAALATLVGAAYAAVSVAWGLGATFLLDTVGGELAAGGRAGEPIVVAALWTAVALKLAAVALPLLVISQAMRPPYERIVRVLTWVEASVLIGYGSALTTVGLLVQADIVHASPDADHRALAWHAFVWDPWFLIWGLLVLAALMGTRRSRR